MTHPAAMNAFAKTALLATHIARVADTRTHVQTATVTALDIWPASPTIKDPPCVKTHATTSLADRTHSAAQITNTVPFVNASPTFGAIRLPAVCVSLSDVYTMLTAQEDTSVWMLNVDWLVVERMIALSVRNVSAPVACICAIRTMTVLLRRPAYLTDTARLDVARTPTVPRKRLVARTVAKTRALSEVYADLMPSVPCETMRHTVHVLMV